MVDIANFRFTDVAGRARDAYEDLNTVRQDIAGRRAGNALQQGDYRGAAGELYGAGMLDAGQELERRKATQDALTQKSKTDQQDSVYKFIAEAAPRLKSIYDQNKADPQVAILRTLKGFDALSGRLRELGETEEEIAQVRQAIEADPDLTLQALGAEAAKKLQFFQTDGAILAGDQTTGEVSVARKLPGKPQMFGDFLYLPEDAAEPAAAPADAPMRTAAPTDDLFGALIQQESGGRPGVLGPQTRYGQAEGMTQMLPATAQAMAQKIGVAWRPELMRGTSEEAAAYQQQLGRAYFEEGLQKYGGDAEKALMYYHGGPNERLWGPKTQAYAQQVLARAGGAPSLQGGSGADDLNGAPQIPGFRAVGRTKAPKEREAPSGYQWQGDRLAPIPGGPADPALERAKPKAPTDGDKKTVGFAYRTLRANDRMNALADRGIFKPTTPTAQLFDRSKSGVVRIVTKTPEDRQFIQSAKEWLAPILRKDTGAAVTDEELSTYMDIFIPKYEDDQPTLQQKAEARQDTMIALVREGGNLFNETHGRRQFVSKYPKPKSAAPANSGPGPNIPADAIKALKRDPRLAGQFDAYYGKGESAKVLGK